MTCDGVGDGCCTYYSEDMCVEQCPIDTDLADCEFNCVERMFPRYNRISHKHKFEIIIMSTFLHLQLKIVRNWR